MDVVDDHDRLVEGEPVGCQAYAGDAEQQDVLLQDHEGEVPRGDGRYPFPFLSGFRLHPLPDRPVGHEGGLFQLVEHEEQGEQEIDG